MTTRRQASSPGKGLHMAGLLEEAGELAQFDDFRRRHSKQNRDIVRENASRLMLNKALQEEIVSLHRELLAVRQTTASMALKIKSLEDEMAQLRSEPTRVAVDAILAAVPALRQLQSALVPSPSTSLPTVEPAKVVPWPEKPILARQMQSEQMLEALTERTEVESECESEREVPTPPRRPRRRESGFIRVPTFSPELEVVDTGRERIRDEEGEVEGIVMDTVAEESESPRSEPLSARRSVQEVDTALAARESAQKSVITQPKPSKTSSRILPKAGKPSRSLSASTASSERRSVVPRVPEPARSSSVSNTPTLAQEPKACVPIAVIPSQTEPTNAVDEDGARSRTGRARKSVNYKEPSLHKKMRKPGSDDEGDSTPSTSGAGVRRKSVLPRHRMVQTAPPMPSLEEKKGADDGRVENQTVRMLLGLDD